MKTILVTGGLGFIGSNLIKLILKTKPQYNIINCDCLTYAGNLDNHKGLAEQYPDRYRFIYGDVSNISHVGLLFDSPGGIDLVLHLAAHSHVDRSISNQLPFITTNIYGSALLLEAARKHGVKRFVQISTDEVYGELGPRGFFRENSPIKPRNPYAATKASADFLSRAAYITHRQPTIVTRCGNNYGKNQHLEKLIPKMITNALLGKSLTVYGDGLDIRDWIHVDDHCRALLAVLERGIPGQVYNIGSTNELTNLEIIRRIAKIMGVPNHRIEYVGQRPGHDRRYAIDACKIRSKLGWEPQVIFDQGLRDTIDWYSNNRDWWSKLITL